MDISRGGTDELLQRIMQELIGYTPPHFSAPYCVVTESARHGQGRLEYQIGCAAHPAESTTRPSPPLHEASYAFYRAYFEHKQGFPGLDLRLHKDGDCFKVAATLLEPAACPRDQTQEETQWRSIYDSREARFTAQFGAMPNEIDKPLNLMGVWPAGCFVRFRPSDANALHACTTFGLSNFDMPTRFTHENAQYEKGSVKFSLKPRTPRWMPAQRAGYGYEAVILTRRAESWPRLPLAWLAQVEILKDVGLLDRVEELGGVTIEALLVGDDNKADFFVAPARAPLPTSFDLPNGRVALLVMTRTTRDEMDFARSNGPKAFIERLQQAGVGQVSDLERGSILGG
jgi:hypothetical protein